MPGSKPKPIAGQPFRPDDPLFTVIVTDYEASVPRHLFRRKMACLAAQSCKDFEVLVYHDGPKAQSYEDDLAGGPMHPATEFIATPRHVGDWGHTARDLGIRAARGRWIIHSNADNVFFPNLVAVLKETIAEPRPWMFALPPRSYPWGLKRLTKWLDARLNGTLTAAQVVESAKLEILIYGIVMRGLVAMKSSYKWVPAAAERQGIIFGGVPVRYGGTDAMQLVMRRDLWLAEGGWHDKSKDSDGMMYPEFARKYRVLPVPAVLGEHW